MFPADEATVTTTTTPDPNSSIQATPAKIPTGSMVATSTRDSSKDAGRVHIGGGMMRF